MKTELRRAAGCGFAVLGLGLIAASYLALRLVLWLEGLLG